MFEEGRLAARPLIIRLGLRDVMNPDFEGQYGANLVGKEARFDELLRAERHHGEHLAGLAPAACRRALPASTPISC